MTTVQTHPARSRWPYAASGVIAAVAGTAAAHLVAGAVNPAASPVLAVGSAVVDATPTPVKEWAVATFGTADKPLLLGSVTVVTLLAAAGIGLLARRHRTLALVLLVGLTGLAGAAALGQPASGQVDVLPALAEAEVLLQHMFTLRLVESGKQHPLNRPQRPQRVLGQLSRE